MTSQTKRSVHVLSLMLLGLVFAACSSSGDGADGAAGPGGPPGPPGPPGPSTGSGIPIDSATAISIAVSNVAVPAGGGAPTVSLTLTNDLQQGLKDLPAGDIRFVLSQLSPGSAGGSSEWQSYVTRTSNGVPDAQADTETATSGTFVDNGDGSYEYTFASALTDYTGGPSFDAAKTHRLGVEIRGQAPITSNGIYDFVPAGGAPLFERKIVDTGTCDACHDRLEFHGGPRTDVEYCVTCHNPYSIDEDSGNTVDMKAMMHNIHSGRDGYVVVGYRGTVHDYSDIVWSQDVRNCQTCHEESNQNTPQASNWQLVPSRAACGTCHYDDGDPLNGVNDYAIEDGDHALGLAPLTDDTQCLVCHGPDSTIADGAVRVAKVHEIPAQIESQRFAYNIVNVADMVVGMNPTVEFSVTNPLDGTYYDILNDVEFNTCAGGASRLAISIAWNTADYTNTGSGAPAAQPIGLNPLTCFGNPGATEVAGNPVDVHVFSITSGAPLPAEAVGTAAVTIDGHPAVSIDGVVNRIPVTNVVNYIGIGTATTVARRDIVDIQKCDDCHNELSLHGNNRTDNPEVCVICHNPNATDVNRRNPPCSDTLGTDDSPIDMKLMIHAIHASGETGVPYQACGFGNSPHEFLIEYPGHVNNCEGCHNPGTYFPVDPASVLGTTVDAGANLLSPTDDRVISPNTAVCSACHTDQLATTHMQQNGGDFNATKAADSQLISSGVETCELCHGEGRSADVEIVHGVGEFQFN